MACDACQRTGSISRRHEMPLNEAIATPINDAPAVINLFKKIIFPRFGVPRAVICDRGTHFGEKQLNALLEKYGVYHRRGLAYHPKTCGQVEVSNCELKLVYRKACHLPVEMEHKAYWVVKELNMDAKLSGEKRLLQLNELDEFRLQAYESSRLYKEITKRWRDKKILKKEFQIGNKVLLFNSRYKLFPGKLRSWWSGPYIVTNVNKFDSVEVMTTNGEKFKANGHRLKVYHKYVIVGLIEEVTVHPLLMEA
ncbi:uncharacterized protein LOC141616950 [Silene latifolia]|uniref:uncharacterized protein LOC141616950 n=1 Tax=Silene latifolia TaxID=37657 RepID=UPI003D77DA32